MRSFLPLGFTAELAVACCSPVAASTAYPNGLKGAQAATSAIEETVYTYRRTKHGFQRCFHRNRFSTRSWRSLIYRVPDC
jgi:hypothetical protein